MRRGDSSLSVGFYSSSLYLSLVITRCINPFFPRSARSVIHSIGEYVKNAYYPLDILHVDGSHQDYLRVERRSGSGSFQSDWTGFLSNLLPSKIKFDFQISYIHVCVV